VAFLSETRRVVAPATVRVNDIAARGMWKLASQVDAELEKMRTARVLPWACISINYYT
jgi:hypothetical protein